LAAESSGDGARRESATTSTSSAGSTLAPDHSQFTEEQKAEAYRIESMQWLIRQTKAVETIRTIMVIWAVLTVIGVCTPAASS